MAKWIRHAVAFVFMLTNTVESSHFMGGTIQWRPLDPENFDGMVCIIRAICCYVP